MAQTWKDVANNLVNSRIAHADFHELTIITNAKFEELTPLLDEAGAWDIHMNQIERAMLCMFFHHAFEE